MREILFRGKRIDNGEWVVGSLICWDDGSCLIETGSLLEPQYAIDSATIGQYTGLDTNGKKIFEGDIVTYGDRIGYVVWGKGSFSVQNINSLHCPAIEIVLWEFDVEIIGNIHDNPELMKGK